MDLSIRIVLRQPPAGVRMGLQKGKEKVVDGVVTDGGDLTLDCQVLVRDGRDGLPDFAGPFVQGPPGGRFIYVNSGVLAGQADTCWERRAKVPLSGITWERIEGVRAKPGSALSVTIPGTSKDGGPICAGVRLAATDWKLVTVAAR